MIAPCRRMLLLAIAFFLITGDLRAAEAPSSRLIPSAETGWPQWRGPRRDGISPEKGLLPAWPEDGPRRLWTASDLGSGYSAPIIADGTVFITGDVGNELHIFALDLDGKLKWKTTNGQSWRRSYPGARSSCVYSEGRLYHLNAHGRLACFNPADGQEIWAVETFQLFEAKSTTWGLAENLLIDGPRVIVTPGGRKAVMAALDKATGQTIWTTPAIVLEQAAANVEPVDNAGYGSPILFEFANRRLIAGTSARHFFCVDAETGELQWKEPLPTTYQVIGLTPVLIHDAIFMTAPDGQGGKLMRLRAEGDGIRAEQAWGTALDTCHGGAIFVNDRLHASWYRRPGWACVDPRTGQVLHQSRDLAMGAVLWADERFYILSQEGVMALVEADDKSFRVVSRFWLTEGKKSDAWTHPVILDGRLYLRYQQNLYCYDIRQ